MNEGKRCVVVIHAKITAWSELYPEYSIDYESWKKGNMYFELKMKLCK